MLLLETKRNSGMVKTNTIWKYKTHAKSESNQYDC